MYYVYALSSINRNYIYVGLTNNLERRLKQHNSGRGRSTRPYAPFKLIYKEKFKTKIEARRKEKFLKHGSGKEFLKTLK